jgi:hypothetical protein
MDTRRNAVIGKLLPEFNGEQRKAEDYFNLGLCDTVHDFWKERKTQGGATVEEGEEEEIVDTTKLEKVHGIVDGVLATTIGLQATTQDIVKDITLNNVTSLTNNFEWAVTRYFETRYPHIGGKKSTMTFEEILTIPTDFESRRRAVELLGDCLELTAKSGKGLKAFTPSERNNIANFIMVYMDSTKDAGTQTKAFTFDANARKVDLVFRDIDQVNNYVFPQTIADSAVTTLTPLKGRCVIQKSDNTVVTSNILTGDTTTITFVDKGFSRQNPYGFELQIAKAGSAPRSLKFSATQKQGPTVNYLVDIMTNGVAALPPTSVLDLRPLDDQVSPELLLDLKRMGDHEQVRESLKYPECYLATVDILCSLYARFLRKPCIFHTSRDFRLYRFPVEQLSPQQVYVKQMVFFAQESIGKLKMMYDYKASAAGIASDLYKSIEQFRLGAEKGFVKSKRATYITDLPSYLDESNNIKLQTTEEEDANLSITFATKLLRLRMYDLLARALMLKAQIDSLYQSAELKDLFDNFGVYYSILNELSNLRIIGGEWRIVDIGGKLQLQKGDANITDLLVKIRNALEKYDVIRRLEFPLNKEGVPINIYTSVFEKNGNVYELKKAGKNIVFGFSCAPYTAIYESVTGLLVKRKGFGGRSRPPSDKIIFANLGQYFESRDAEKESYYDETTKTVVEEATDIPSGSPQEMVMNVPQMILKVLAIANPVIPPETQNDVAREAIDVGIRDEAVAQVAGAGSVQQYYDLDTLFGDICSMASMTVDTILSEASPDRSPTLREAIDILRSDVYIATVIRAYDDIESYWKSELRDIEFNALDTYGVEYQKSETDSYINQLLNPTPDEEMEGGGLPQRGLLKAKKESPEQARKRREKEVVEARRAERSATLASRRPSRDDVAKQDLAANLLTMRFGDLLDSRIVALIVLVVFDNYRVRETTDPRTKKTREHFSELMNSDLDGYYDASMKWDDLWIDVQTIVISLQRLSDNPLRGGRKTYRRRKNKKRSRTYRKRKD